MSNKILIFGLALISLSFFSCRENEPPISSENKIYFDLTKIIKDDIRHNTINNCAEEKTVYIQYHKETKKIDTIDWQKELQPLLECDINRPAWKGKFYIDTIPNDLMHDTTLQYRALSNKVSIRSLSIIYANQQIKKIIIEKKIKSVLFSTSQLINYIPKFGFIIRGEQKALFMTNFDLNVDVKYLCK
jgi:hypothetical protein